MNKQHNIIDSRTKSYRHSLPRCLDVDGALYFITYLCVVDANYPANRYEFPLAEGSLLDERVKVGNPPSPPRPPPHVPFCFDYRCQSPFHTWLEKHHAPLPMLLKMHSCHNLLTNFEMFYSLYCFLGFWPLSFIFKEFGPLLCVFSLSKLEPYGYE